MSAKSPDLLLIRSDNSISCKQYRSPIDTEIIFPESEYGKSTDRSYSKVCKMCRCYNDQIHVNVGNQTADAKAQLLASTKQIKLRSHLSSKTYMYAVLWK